MIRGVYAAAAGLVARMARLSVISNNLANAQTIGFKQDLVTDRHFQELQLALLHARGLVAPGRVELVGAMSSGPVATPPTLDLAQGAITETGYEGDFALGGPGFFVVLTPDGLRYTRDGSFDRDAQGRLVTLDGHLVMGENGPITLPDGEILAAADGTLSVDGTAVDRLLIVDFPEGGIRKEGANLFVADEGAVAVPVEGTTVYQGYLEASNVDMTQAMVSLIELRHAYTMNARMLQLQDQVIDRSVNEVGRVA